MPTIKKIQNALDTLKAAIKANQLVETDSSVGSDYESPIGDLWFVSHSTDCTYSYLTVSLSDTNPYKKLKIKESK